MVDSLMGCKKQNDSNKDQRIKTSQRLKPLQQQRNKLEPVRTFDCLGFI